MGYHRHPSPASNPDAFSSATRKPCYHVQSSRLVGTAVHVRAHSVGALPAPAAGADFNTHTDRTLTAVAERTVTVRSCSRVEPSLSLYGSLVPMSHFLQGTGLTAQSLARTRHRPPALVDACLNNRCGYVFASWDPRRSSVVGLRRWRLGGMGWKPLCRVPQAREPSISNRRRPFRGCPIRCSGRPATPSPPLPRRSGDNIPRQLSAVLTQHEAQATRPDVPARCSWHLFYIHSGQTS